MKKLIAAGFVVLLAASAPSLASHGRYETSVDERQQVLDRRIERGWQNGELTRREYRQLRRVRRDAGRTQEFFAEDGWLSRRELNDLHARLSEEVYRQKRDGERQYGSYNPEHRAANRRY